MNKLFYCGYWMGHFNFHILGCGFEWMNFADPIFRINIFHFTVIQIGKSIFGSRFELFGFKIF